ncbi:MAG: hypothetical protein GF364_22210 [Candidatus Lokiarchaeota archaeon]|nr:hypothetical protein [Candidatus Lokiarchaeota archaeon]
MSWEIEAPELPDDIRTILVEIKTAILDDFDWTIEANRWQAHKTWIAMRNSIAILVKETPELNRALTYKASPEMEKALNNLWAEFLKPAGYNLPKKT